jgi:glycosyltransferase involved in cell wall biosynthesis
MTDKISIITRAFNRLEYTMRTIHSVRKNTNHENYEHIIVNNNSTDGTKEWLDWIKKEDNHPYFNKVKVLHLEKNVGDWMGMRRGLAAASPDSKYVVQLDNDMEVDSGWLNAMKHVIDETDINLVMCKRTGVGAVLRPKTPKTIKNGDQEIKYGYITKCVACFMAKMDKFKEISKHIKGKGNKTVLGQKMRPCGKIFNIFCHHNDGYYNNEENKDSLIYNRFKTWESL